MNSTFDIRSNCVKIKADIKGRGLQFRGSGVLYPLDGDDEYDYIFTAQHIFKDTRKKKLNAVLDKIGTIEIEVFEDGHFVTYKTITKDTISNSLLPIGEDFLIIKIDKSEKHFTPFLLADDLIEEKSMQLYGVSGEAQDIITRLDCKCVDSKVDLVNITSHVDKMDSLHGMSGGGVFAQNQPLMYGVLWKYAATNFLLALLAYMESAATHLTLTLISFCCTRIQSLRRIPSLNALNEMCSMKDIQSICMLLTFAPNSTVFVSLPLTMGRI